ncbi:hypothetical protein JQ662_000227 [Listeria monocytogenes]|nr:hypothetical protein [Listeria monocytogenes]
MKQYEIIFYMNEKDFRAVSREIIAAFNKLDAVKRFFKSHDKNADSPYWENLHIVSVDVC